MGNPPVGPSKPNPAAKHTAMVPPLLFREIRHEDIAGKDAVRAAFKASVSPAPA
jgi:hypothetical protein